MFKLTANAKFSSKLGDDHMISCKSAASYVGLGLPVLLGLTGVTLVEAPVCLTDSK
jgi:hypothetical protein